MTPILLSDRSLTGFLGPAGIVFLAPLPSATLQSLCCSLASVGNASVTLLLSLGDKNPAWLPPAITPYPGVDIIMSAAIACPFAATVSYTCYLAHHKNMLYSIAYNILHIYITIPIQQAFTGHLHWAEQLVHYLLPSSIYSQSWVPKIRLCIC